MTDSNTFETTTLVECMESIKTSASDIIQELKSGPQDPTTLDLALKEMINLLELARVSPSPSEPRFTPVMGPKRIKTSGLKELQDVLDSKHKKMTRLLADEPDLEDDEDMEMGCSHDRVEGDSDGWHCLDGEGWDEPVETAPTKTIP